MQMRSFFVFVLVAFFAALAPRMAKAEEPAGTSAGATATAAAHAPSPRTELYRACRRALPPGFSVMRVIGHHYPYQDFTRVEAGMERDKGVEWAYVRDPAAAACFLFRGEVLWIDLDVDRSRRGYQWDNRTVRSTLECVATLTYVPCDAIGAAVSEVGMAPSRMVELLSQ